MSQSMNKTVDCVVKAASYHGLTTYGQIMVGDCAFEFYNDRNTSDYIQIPWTEVSYVSALLFGKKICRFAIHTKKDGDFSFSARDAKKVLRAVREYVPADKILRSLTMLDVLKKKIKGE